MTQSTPRLWLLYLLLLAVLSGLFFADLADLGLDTHDAETFRDHERINADFSFFFSADKEQLTGRPFAELFRYAASLLIGNAPAHFHLLVAALHALCALVLARCAFSLGTALPISLVGGLLFLVNVAHFQAVHLIAALDYPLALLLVLSALLAYAQHLQTRSSKMLLACYLLCVLAALSHLFAVAVWPFVLYFSWLNSENRKVALKFLLPLALLIALAFAANLALASHQTSTWDSLERYPQAHIFALMADWGQVLLWLGSRLLSTAHWLPIKVYQMQNGELVLGVLFIAALIYLAWHRQLWAAWSLLFLLPFVFLTQQTLLDMPVGPSRYLYPASAGTSLLLAQALLRYGRPLALVLLIALLVSSFYSLQKTEALSRYTSGRSYIANADLPNGISQLLTAIAQAPEDIDLEDTYIRLAAITLDSASVAEPMLNEALQRFPQHPKLAIAREVLRSLSKEAPTRVAATKRLDYLGKQSEGNATWINKLYENAGHGYALRDARRDAIYAYQQALLFAPRHVQIRLKLGWLLFADNRFEEAIAHYQQILSQEPNAQAQFDMALAYITLGHGTAAQQAYANGMAQYGREEAERSGAHQNLQRLISLGIHTSEASSLLQEHFPD